jgi:RNA polymerase sigma-70 factor (ECF subfamily)
MARDEDWIRLALEQYEKPLTRYAAHITGDPEQAREIVQDTFLKLCSTKPARLREYLAQWLYTVCRNRALDVVRKERRMTSLTEARLETQPDPDAGPSSALERSEQLGQILEVLAMLPANQQEVLRLKFQCDLSYQEISKITSLSAGNVGFLIHTGLKAIRQEIAARTDPKALRRVK